MGVGKSVKDKGL